MIIGPSTKSRMSRITCLQKTLDFIPNLEDIRGIFTIFNTRKKDKEKNIEEGKEIYFETLWQQQKFLLIYEDGNRSFQAVQKL